MIYKISGNDFFVDIQINEDGANISAGRFGDMSLLSSPVFEMRLKKLENGENILLSSDSGWGRVEFKENEDCRELIFDNPCGISDITVFVNANVYEHGIYWTEQVVCDSSEYSVMEITYPTPKIHAQYFNLFVPQNSGFVVEDAEKQTFAEESYYPSWPISMQYFAMYGKSGGIYVATEDGKAGAKLFRYSCKEEKCNLTITFPAIGAGMAGNSFEPYGKCHWRAFSGDWYDATEIYSEFVQREATWLPEINENGRPDLAERFKKVPFWISDYIPNTEYQRENKPMNLSAGSDIYDKDYWYQAPIALQKELGVPIAYHVYNWHEIPFNIEYPHFMPARKEFTDHIKELQDNNIYVLPYINAIAWEMNDSEAEHSLNFENTGRHLATLKEDGEYFIEKYPQTTKSGKGSHLASMCGSCETWHKLMQELSRKMEAELNIDGIYYDEVSASPAVPCFNREHNHLPGGGNYRVEGYGAMMEKINKDKPKENFSFSECNAEAYMKQFDGFLTWMWVARGEVPAFATLYSGYIQMIGRCTIGNKKDDFEFFKYCTAKSFLCGQQLGWCKADIVYSSKHMEFIKNAVRVRYEYTDVFNSAKLLRPPSVKADLPKLVTKAGLWFGGDIVSEQVLVSSWKYRNNSKILIFAVNISETVATYSFTFNIKEYGLENTALPEEFTVTDDICTVQGSLGKYEIKVWEINF